MLHDEILFITFLNAGDYFGDQIHNLGVKFQT